MKVLFAKGQTHKGECSNSEQVVTNDFETKDVPPKAQMKEDV